MIKAGDIHVSTDRQVHKNHSWSKGLKDDQKTKLGSFFFGFWMDCFFSSLGTFSIQIPLASFSYPVLILMLWKQLLAFSPKKQNKFEVEMQTNDFSQYELNEHPQLCHLLSPRLFCFWSLSHRCSKIVILAKRHPSQQRLNWTRKMGGAFQQLSSFWRNRTRTPVFATST